jgi:hypothetical protein
MNWRMRKQNEKKEKRGKRIETERGERREI